MVYHIILWNFKEGVAEEAKPQLKSEMKKQLNSLVGIVPGLLTVDFVAEPVSSSTHDIALITTFEHAEDIKNYATHPAHVEVADKYVRPYVCNRACLDCEI